MDVKKFLSEIGINAIALLAGAIGGLIAVVMSEKQVSFRSALAQILCAVAFAGYGAERVVIWLDWQSNPSATGLLGLCLGLTGMQVARGISNWMRRFEKDPVSFIKNKGGSNVADH